LSSVYGMIKEHKGTIDVKSEIGSGSVFSLYLPLVTKEISNDSDETGKLAYGSGTILIVDDEVAIRILLKDLLNNLGYKVLVAENGLEAKEIYRANHDEIDLVVLDMIMLFGL